MQTIHVWNYQMHTTFEAVVNSKINIILMIKHKSASVYLHMREILNKMMKAMQVIVQKPNSHESKLESESVVVNWVDIHGTHCSYNHIHPHKNHLFEKLLVSRSTNVEMLITTNHILSISPGQFLPINS